MADGADRADVTIEAGLENSLAAHLSRQSAEAEYDDDGNRVCVECAEVIPEPRVLAVNAVECVECAAASEKRERLYR